MSPIPNPMYSSHRIMPLVLWMWVKISQPNACSILISNSVNTGTVVLYLISCLSACLHAQIEAGGSVRVTKAWRPDSLCVICGAERSTQAPAPVIFFLLPRHEPDKTPSYPQISPYIPRHDTVTFIYTSPVTLEYNRSRPFGLRRH